MTQFLDSRDIDQAFTSDLQLIKFAKYNNIFLNGVFSKDQIPRHLHPGGYIINMANSNLEGTHWVAFWINHKKEAEYFDSFGVDPPREIEHALRPYKYLVSNKIIQNYRGGYCGAYCLLFLKSMQEGATLKDFQKLWSDDYQDNKRILLRRLGR